MTNKAKTIGCAVSANPAIGAMPPSSQKVVQAFAQDICTILLLTYIVLIPGGILGFGIAFTCLLLKLFLSRNMLTIGVYLLLFGMKTMGLVTLAFGQPGLGGKAAFLLAITILVFFTDLRKTVITLRIPLIQLLWIFLIFYLSFLHGPQTQYCADKLSNIIVFGVVFLISFYYLLGYRSVDWFHLGQLGVISALVCLSSIVILEPISKPHSFIDIGHMRTALEINIEFTSIRNTLGYIAVLGFVVLYASVPDHYLSRFKLIDFYVYLGSALIILAWGGARLPIASAVFAVIFIFLAKPLYSLRYRFFSILLIVVAVVAVSYSLSKNLQLVESVVVTDSSLSERFNRGANWEAGYKRFIERPLFGHGLGGYYIEGFSYPGGGTYAHNIFLELLSETGAVGSLLIIAPFLIRLRALGKNLLLARSKSGGAIFPLVLILFFQAMISFDLSINVALLSMFAFVGTFPGLHKRYANK